MCHNYGKVFVVRPTLLSPDLIPGSQPLNVVEKLKAFKSIESLIAETRPSIHVYNKTWKAGGDFFKAFLGAGYDISKTPPTEEMYLNYCDYLRNDCKYDSPLGFVFGNYIIVFVRYAASTVCCKMSMMSSKHNDIYGIKPMKVWDRLVAYVFWGLKDHEAKQAKQFSASDIFEFVSIRTENRFLMVRQAVATLG